MGFGSLLGCNCSGIPSKLGYFVVDSFDPKSMKLRLPNGSIQITVELIHHIYGIPYGGTPINSLVVNNSTKECYRAWTSQFVKDIRPSEVARKIEESEDDDMVFVQNFLTLFFNSMVECLVTGSCDTDLLERIDDSVDIKSIDWCGYIFESLKGCKRLWKRDDSGCYFNGPIVFLVLLYLEASQATVFKQLNTPSNVQAMHFWSVEKMKKREILETELSGGFGRCEIKNLTEKEAVQEESESEITKLLDNIESKLDSLLDVKIALEFLFSSGIEKFPECATLKEKKKLFHDILNITDPKADTTIVCLYSKYSKDDDAVRNYLAIDTDDFVDDQPESCPQCHRNLLVGCTKCYPDEAYPVRCNLIEAKLKGSNGHTDDLQDQFVNVAAGDVMNPTNGWKCESDNCKDTSSVHSVLSPSVNHPPAALEDPGISEGLWRGNAVGQPAKEILQAVEDRYPDTFQGIQILPKSYWSFTLKGLHDIIKGFLETSAHALTEDQLTSLDTDISFFERIGFNLSWVRNRLHMVKDLKFGNDPLRLELAEANARFEKARLEYDRATDARNKKLHEVAQKLGAEYDGVLNGVLGFGMLPGY